MPQIAYDSLVGEFLWLGMHTKYALKLAGLLYPEDEIYYKDNEEFFDVYAESVMDFHHYKYDEFEVDETFQVDVDLFDEIRQRGNYSRVRIYLDGANLLRSYAFIKDKRTIVDDIVERDVSINVKNYARPFIDEQYPIWFIVYAIIEATGIEKSLLDAITFVMCEDDENMRLLFDKIRRNFPIEVISPDKIGFGLKSSSNEDKVLKELIISDLNANKFDVAIIGTGDGNKKDGISFPEIGRLIQKTGKQVFFMGMDITASKAIKENFEFFDFSHPAFQPRSQGHEISGLDLP